MSLADFPPENYFQGRERNSRGVRHKYMHMYIHISVNFEWGPSSTVKTDENSEENSVCEDNNSQGKQKMSC